MLDDNKLLADLELDEGRRAHVYKCPANKNTIGIGRNIDDLGLSKDEEIFCDATAQDLIAGRGLSDMQINYLCRNDIARCKRELDQHCPWWKALPEPAARGFANMLFNMGWTRLSGFKKMLAALEVGAFNVAAEQAQDSAWHDQVGARAERIEALFRSCA